MADWTLEDLEHWDELIIAKGKRFGLDCYPQEFEICDHQMMLGYMAYSGMTSRYPHWSYGKAYEMQKTLYDHGVSGLPYELVINSNPALAYLMNNNSLCLQILTIAHVYGHNDFFKNNFTFRTTQAENTISRFKSHADLVRKFVEDPSIGAEAVEHRLDAAHALSLQCRRNLSVKKLTIEEDRKRLIDAAKPQEDPFRALHRRPEYKEPNLSKIPPSPDEDILLFIADFNPFLKDWERILLRIVHEEAQYFIPQIETKIMNEGWASFWHREILNSLNLPQDLHLEFLVRHNQVARPIHGGLNPYHLGLKTWDDIRHRYDEAKIGKICDDHSEDYDRNGAPGDLGKLSGLEKVFEVRLVERDSSFIRRFLTEHLIRELDLFEYKPKDKDLVISNVADSGGWKEVKETLMNNVGMKSVPVIKVTECDMAANRSLRILHDHDGRDLHLEYAEKTMGYLYGLWGAPVSIETELGGNKTLLNFDDKGFSTKLLK